ncbi:unnamed protein product, partial [Pylaiella littoralis]
MVLSEVLKRPAVPIAETEWGGRGERRSRIVGSWKTCLRVAQKPVPPSNAFALIDPSTGRTLKLERVRASSANKERKQRHRQPPPEPQQEPRAQQQEPYQRVEAIETKPS